MVYLVSHFCIFVLLLAISLLKMAPKYNVEVLSSIPQHKKVVMCLMEKYMCSIHFVQTGVIVLLAMS